MSQVKISEKGLQRHLNERVTINAMFGAEGNIEGILHEDEQGLFLNNMKHQGTFESTPTTYPHNKKRYVESGYRVTIPNTNGNDRHYMINLPRKSSLPYGGSTGVAPIIC
jgi:hypothetical protein